jgi:hypothetical protein
VQDEATEEDAAGAQEVVQSHKFQLFPELFCLCIQEVEVPDEPNDGADGKDASMPSAVRAIVKWTAGKRCVTTCNHSACCIR